jgi:hypothetical protein
LRSAVALRMQCSPAIDIHLKVDRTNAAQTKSNRTG